MEAFRSVGLKLLPNSSQEGRVKFLLVSILKLTREASGDWRRVNISGEHAAY